MRDSVGLRIRTAFREEERDSLLPYLEWTRTTYKECVDATRRATLYLFLSMAIFLIMAQYKTAEVTIGPVKLSQASALLVFLPPLVAYFFLDLIVTQTRTSYLADAWENGFWLWNPEAEALGLDAVVAPPPATYAMSYSSDGLHQNPALDKSDTLIQNATGGLGVLGTLAFQFYAFFALFGWLHAPGWTTWLSLAVTGLITGVANTYLVRLVFFNPD